MRNEDAEVCEELRQRYRDSLGIAFSDAEKDGGKLLGDEKAEEEAEEDVWTLWILYDERGNRYRSWREVVRDSTENVFADSEFDGPPTTQNTLTHMERYGGDPRGWLQKWQVENKVEEGRG